MTAEPLWRGPWDVLCSIDGDNPVGHTDSREVEVWPAGDRLPVTREQLRAIFEQTPNRLLYDGYYDDFTDEVWELLAAAATRPGRRDSVSDRDCVFCNYKPTPPAAVLYEWPDALVIRPLNPVTSGHVLIVPKAHVATAADDPTVTAAAFARAAQWTKFRADEAFNLITSVGPLATQTVFHLHVHYVPRRERDGLRLPWAPVPSETEHNDS